MACIPDLMKLLCLEAKSSSSPLGGQHRTILIEKDFTNTGDFAFSSFLQYFSRKEPKTPILLIALDNNWTHYSASAIKCGVSLRKTQNSGKIEFLDVGSMILNTLDDSAFDPCKFIAESTETFIKNHTPNIDNETEEVQPLIIMIDDTGALLTMGCSSNEIYQMIAKLDKTLRERSIGLPQSCISHLIVQTVAGYACKNSLGSQVYSRDYNNLNHLISNLENICDMALSLKPLDTGFSTRVDGTIMIVDNRLPTPKNNTTISQTSSLSLFPDKSADVGTKKAFFFKISDRRVRLTSSALIF